MIDISMTSPNQLNCQIIQFLKIITGVRDLEENNGKNYKHKHTQYNNNNKRLVVLKSKNTLKGSQPIQLTISSMWLMYSFFSASGLVSSYLDNIRCLKES